MCASWHTLVQSTLPGELRSSAQNESRTWPTNLFSQQEKRREEKGETRGKRNNTSCEVKVKRDPKHKTEEQVSHEINSAERIAGRGTERVYHRKSASDV